MINVHKDLLREISIHAPHEGERRVACNAGGYFVDISIHAPHEGERPVIHKLLLFKRRISIHAPHEGERHTLTLGELRIIARFQSTLPTRGSDELGARTPRDEVNFNPRSPRGGATSCNKPSRGARCNFNPRSPRGGATDIQYNTHRRIPISIHAPHEGERLGGSKSMGKKVKISIHAPHEGERRTSAHGASAHNSNFNPRSPRGGATAQTAPQLRCDRKFQSTLPTRGSDGP